MKKLRREFGQQLRFYRRQAGLSQEDLGFEADLHRNYISQIERGLSSPTFETFYRLCRSMEVDPEEFVRELKERVES